MKNAHKNGATRQANSAVPNQTLTHGEIVTWTVSGQRFKHADVIQALKDNGLHSERLLRDILPRNAFARASKALAEERVIDLIDEDKDTITFQFTARKVANGRADYQYETELKLDKHSGKVTCPVADLAKRAKDELDRCMVERTPSDITNTVQKLFEQNADLFRIRDQGGAYFVPEMHRPFLDQIEKFLTGLNGTMRRYLIAKGSVAGDKSIQETVTDGLAEMIRDHEKAVGEFGLSTRKATLTDAAEKYKRIKFKLECYAAYLSAERTKLEDALAEGQRALVERSKRLMASWESDCHAECDHCKAVQGVPDDAEEWECLECGQTFPLVEAPAK